MKSPWTRRLLWIYVLTFAAILLLPSVYIVIISLDPLGLGLLPREPSLKWYYELPGQVLLLESLKRSVTLGVATAASSVFLALLAARTYRHMRYKSLFMVFMIMPIFIPGVISGFDNMLYFKLIGVAGSWVATWLAHTTWALPFAFIYLLTAMSTFDPNLLDAAGDLGANGWQAFTLIELPLISMGLVGAFIITFTLSLNEFIRTFYLQGLNMTLTTFIFGFFRIGIVPTIFSLSGAISVLSLVLLSAAALLILISGKNKGTASA